MRSEAWLAFRIILEIESSVCSDPAVPALLKTTVSTWIAQAGSNHTMCFLCLVHPSYFEKCMLGAWFVLVLPSVVFLTNFCPHCSGHSSQTSQMTGFTLFVHESTVCFEDWLLFPGKVNISILALHLKIFQKQVTSALTKNCRTITTPQKTHPPLN